MSAKYCCQAVCGGNAGGGVRANVTVGSLEALDLVAVVGNVGVKALLGEPMLKSPKSVFQVCSENEPFVRISAICSFVLTYFNLIEGS